MIDRTSIENDLRASGRNIEDIMGVMGIRQADLARALGVAPSLISKWTMGDYRIPKWGVRCIALLAELEDLQPGFVAELYKPGMAGLESHQRFARELSAKPDKKMYKKRDPK